MNDYKGQLVSVVLHGGIIVLGIVDGFDEEDHRLRFKRAGNYRSYLEWLDVWECSEETVAMIRSPSEDELKEYLRTSRDSRSNELVH